MTLFVDTSVWYAAADRDDTSNARAKELIAGRDDLLTTDHVLVESWLLTRGRLGRSAAERLARGMRRAVTALEFTTAADLERALAIAERFLDQDFSIVDRTSFAVMERLGVTQVASFDDDFAIYRYGNRRQFAFEVLR